MEVYMNVRKGAASAAILALVSLLFLSGCSGTSSNQRITIEVTTPAARGSVTEGEVTVSGIVSDAEAALRIDDTVVPVAADGSFSHTVALAYGANRISLRAEKEGVNPGTRTLTVNRNLTLTVNSPEAATETNAASITVAGSISDPTARITVTGSDVPVIEDGTFLVEVPLYYAETVINVTAHVEGTTPVTETLTIIRPEA
jgi:hypothetical protein